MIISCRELNFDESLSKNRMNRALNIFSEAVIKRVLCFALYLLGATRNSIAKQLVMPTESAKTLIKNIYHNGLPALEDRRYSRSAFLPQKVSEPSFKITTSFDKEFLWLDFGIEQKKFKIPLHNKLQIRTILLTMLDSKILTTKQVAELLELSSAQTMVIAKDLKENDVDGLLDQRQGQQQDYVFTLEAKAEVIQQFSANAAVGTKTSSEVLAKDIRLRCGLDLSPRTIRFHMDKLGLSKLKQTLPELIESLKKTQKFGE